MDLLSTIRKSGSRGGVNFSWDDVSTSAHRENYLGHSLKAPVGRWQKGRDLNWYAKADDSAPSDETAEERQQRERKEEIRRIKEAEEDALNRALGLPVVDRSNSGGVSSGANNIGLGEMKRLVGEAGVEESEGKGFGDFFGKVGGAGVEDVVRTGNMEQGGLMDGEKKRTDDKGERGRRRDDGEDHRRSRRHDKDDRRARDGRRRSRSPRRDHKRDERRERNRSRSPHRERRRRSRSPGSARERPRGDSRDRRQGRDRSRSRERRDSRRHRDRSIEGHRHKSHR